MPGPADRATPPAARPLRRARPPVTGAPAYLGAALTVAAVTALAWAAHRAIALPDVEMLFLLAVTLAGVLFGLGPSLLAALLSVAAYDFFFVAPAFTLEVQEPRYLLTFAVMFGAGALTSTLTSRLREQRQAALVREARAAAQYALSSALAGAQDVPAVAAAAARFAQEALGGAAAVLAPSGAEGAPSAAGEADLRVLAGPDRLSPDLLAWARTALATGRAAGQSDGVLCLPLALGVEPVAVLALAPWPDPQADPERGLFLEALGRQIALAFERVKLAEEARRATLRAAAEEQRSALLSTVSHDLRTPLAAITGAATALREGAGLDAAQRAELLDLVCDEAERLERLVSDLLDMTRLQGGAVQLRREWLPLDEVVGTALARAERSLAGRPVEVDVGSPPLVPVDPVLLERLLVNLLENAARYTPPGTPVTIRAAPAEGGCVLTVADRGPGLPPGAEERVFERFYRGAHPGVAGAGLGLAIARAVARAHGGELTAGAAPGGGAQFRLWLPFPGPPPAVLPEAAEPPPEAP